MKHTSVVSPTQVRRWFIKRIGDRDGFVLGYFQNYEGRRDIYMYIYYAKPDLAGICLNQGTVQADF